MPSPTVEADLASLGASELVRWLAAGELTSGELTQACIERIEAVNPTLRAVSIPLFDDARKAAEAADRTLADCRASGDQPPALCGLPVTIKDCFDAAGVPSTLGIDRFTDNRAAVDSPLVARLRAAGAVVVGKTNVPQAMMLHCCDNPVYGRTLHPRDAGRGPGGSSGGEAAIIAAGGSPLGLGSDLGGSIRQPAHVCGLAGLKPTSGRLSNLGSRRGLAGMNAIAIQAGPIAHRVEDLHLMMAALTDDSVVPIQLDEVHRPWRDYREVRVGELTIACCESDGWFEPAPTCRRAVNEAAAALSASGAHVANCELPHVDEAMRLYLGLMSADGFKSIRRMLSGSEVDWQVRRQVWFAALPRPLRRVVGLGLRLLGQRWLAAMLALTGPRSADAYWRMTIEAQDYATEFWQYLEARLGRRVDAVLLPPHALPALRHGTALDLLPAASYCYLANLLAAPAGVVPWTTVADDEQHYPHGTRFDLVMRLARRAMQRSVGFPVGVQVVARPWREDVALAVMACLEQARATDPARGGKVPRV